MPSRTLPGLGLKADWDLGEDNWKDEMDTNLLTASVLVQARVLNVVTVLPAGVEGAVYLCAADHATQANKIAAYDEGAWVYWPPFEGMRVYDLTNKRWLQYSAAGAWVNAAALAVTTSAATAYGPVLGDANGYKRMTAATAIVITVPDNATVPFSIGTRLTWEANGAGEITVAGAGGVTIRSRGGSYTSAGQYAVLTAVKVAADEWVLSGDVD
jgi:hypothetical protein